MNATTSLSRSVRGWAYWIPVACTLVLVAIAAKRIKTYVTAQDPYWYIGLAHSILGGRSDPAEFAHGLSYVSPGFPLLLAGCIKLFGVYAPYWLNPLLAVGTLFLYAELMRHLFPGRHAVRIMLPGTLLLLFGGYSLNVHFLLYPFRGMSIYFLSLLGTVLLCLRAGSAGKPKAYLIAGLPFAAAVAIREPAVIAVGGAALWILMQGGPTRSQSWKNVGWFLLPLVAGGILLTAVVMAQGRAMNNQLESWLGIVAGKEFGQVLVTTRTMAGDLASSLRVGGILLGLVGIWTCRKSRAVLCFFLLPAIGFFLFYSLYLPHYRYLLTVLVFASPVICAGGLELVERVDNRFPRLRAPWLVCALLVLATTSTVLAMEPWGRKVSGRQVRTFQDSLQSLAPEGGVAFVDPACRYLVDALVSYSDLALLNPGQVRGELAAGNRCFHFRPLDPNAYYDGYLDQTLPPLGVAPDPILTFYAHREQVLHPDGTPWVVSMANGQFAVEEVFPWDRQVVRERFTLLGQDGHTIWLDFGEQDPGTTADLHLEDRHGTVVAEWPDVPARHIQGFYAPVSRTGTGLRVLEVRCEAALPAQLLRGVMGDDQAMKFSLGAQRSPSTHYWLQPPFTPAQFEDAKAGFLHPAGRLVLPVPHGAPDRAIDYLLVLETPTDTGEQRLRLDGPGGQAATWPISPPRSYASFSLPAPHPHPVVATGLALTREAPVAGGRVSSIAITVRPSEASTR